MIGIFKLLPPSISIPIFYFFTILFYLLRSLTQTTFGVLILSSMFYVYLGHYSLSKPFTFTELLTWLDLQPQDSKVAVGTSLLTIVGFIVAFDSANRSWKSQLQAQLKANAAGELESFFTQVQKLITDVEIYIEGVVHAYETIENEDPKDEVISSVQRAVSGNERFLANRRQLSQSLVEVHNLRGRNYSILSSELGLASTFDRASRALENIGNTMWFTIPEILFQEEDPIFQFLIGVQIEKYRAFLDSTKRYGAPMAMYAASIKGQIFAPIIGQNFPAIVDLLKNRRELRKAFEALHGDMNEKTPG